jgi:hypothetical protein
MPKVDSKGNQRQAFLFRDPFQPFDLLAMHKELPFAQRVRIEPIAECIRSDVKGDKPQLVVFDKSVGIGERQSPFLDRFHLGPREGDSALELLLDGVIESGLAVDGQYFDASFGF